ncbi:hypothetical protein VF21_02534 [Pseudogymnoascus sp. 05NY08]|nr:hypothetical protein VF21_02534 [Pseudogymnoascus sp. 05NY08]
MHFHLATILILVPLLTAAPTPKIEQREPADVTDTVTGALGQLTGGLGNIPTGSGKRADIAQTLTTTLGGLTGGLTKIPNIPKMPAGSEKRADIAETLTTTLGGLTGGLTKIPGGKRQVPDIAKTLTEAVNQITGGDLTKLPTGGKRGEPAGITDTLTNGLSGLGGGLPSLFGRKRQAPDVAGTLKSVVDLALGQGNEKNPKQLLGKRESVDVGKVLEEVFTVAKPVTNFPNGKRDTIDVTKALGEIVDPVNEALKKDYTKDFKFPNGVKKKPLSERDSIDVTKALGEIVDPVNEALKKDYTKDFKFPAGTKKPIAIGERDGKHNDGIDVTKTLGEIVSPFSDALGKDYSKGYTLPDGTKIPPSKRGGIDGSGAVAAVLGQVTNAIEHSKDFQPTTESHGRRADILGGFLGTLTGGGAGAGGLLTPPGSGHKRDQATDAANAVPLGGALLQLAKVLGGGALKDGKVPADFKLPDGIPPKTAGEKRIDVASAAKGVVYEIIDGVTRPTKNL